MNKILGTWNGEYSINHGSEKEPNIQYFNFELRVKGDEDRFSGKFIDQTLKTKESSIQGFQEDNFISFVRTSIESPELLKFLSFQVENSNKPLEINFSGNYNEKEIAFEGIWELTVDEENEGMQESVLEELRTGAWYMRKL